MNLISVFGVHVRFPPLRLSLVVTSPCRSNILPCLCQDSDVQPQNAGTSPNGVRQSQVFHGYTAYPPNPTVGGAAMAPPLHDGMDHLGGPGGPNAAAITAAAAKTEEEDRNTALFGDVPEAKRRKFILVDDPHRGARVRVRVMLDQVEMKEIPDSYRKTNCVYPRSYFPMQMQSPPTSARGSRFFEDDDDDDDEGEEGQPTKGRTMVPVPMLDGAEGEVAVPKITKSKRNKEVTLNDLGYRMSWSQSRVFAGRTMFLQRARESHRAPDACECRIVRRSRLTDAN